MQVCVSVCACGGRYSWLEPSDEEIGYAYNELYGPEPHISDDSDSESEAGDEDEDEEDEDEEGTE